MTERKAVPTAHGPLEDYTAQFDDLWVKAANGNPSGPISKACCCPETAIRSSPAWLGPGPIEESQHSQVQKLQYFLFESPWDGASINARRLELMLDDPSTHPHQEGVLIIDHSEDRKSGNSTDPVARQCMGSIGKIDNGIVAVSSLWADERLYFPLHALPYTPAGQLPGGRKDPHFQTKPQLGLELVASA